MSLFHKIFRTCTSTPSACGRSWTKSRRGATARMLMLISTALLLCGDSNAFTSDRRLSRPVASPV